MYLKHILISYLTIRRLTFKRTVVVVVFFNIFLLLSWNWFSPKSSVTSAVGCKSKLAQVGKADLTMITIFN